MSLHNHQINSILRTYEERRLNSHREAEARRNEIYKAIPEFKALEDEIAHASIEAAKRSIFTNVPEPDGIQAKNSELSARKASLLRTHGYPEDYLQERYVCSDCCDTGYINNQKCHCFRQAIVDVIYEQSNLQRIVKTESFENFSFDYYSDEYTDETTNLTPRANMHQVVAQVRDFIDNFDKKHNNLLLYGNTGVGKTFLSNCVAAELLKKGTTVIYFTAFELFDLLEHYKFDRTGNRYNEDFDDISERFSFILDCDLLIIDDLGTEMNNTFVTSQLYLCINERLLRQKSTLISTNLSFDQLKNNYSERIFSRIASSYNFLKIYGDDIRILKKLS